MNGRTDRPSYRDARTHLKAEYCISRFSFQTCCYVVIAVTPFFHYFERRLKVTFDACLFIFRSHCTVYDKRHLFSCEASVTDALPATTNHNLFLLSFSSTTMNVASFSGKLHISRSDTVDSGQRSPVDWRDFQFVHSSVRRALGSGSQTWRLNSTVTVN